MKKLATKSKLALKSQTIRVLTHTDLSKVVGGLNGQTTHHDTQVCADTMKVG